jgi:hypothetical protein
LNGTDIYFSPGQVKCADLRNRHARAYPSDFIEIILSAPQSHLKWRALSGRLLKRRAKNRIKTVQENFSRPFQVHVISIFQFK